MQRMLDVCNVCQNQVGRSMYMEKWCIFLLTSLVVISAVFSFVLTCYFSSTQLAFYILPSRFWEMALGTLVFVMTQQAGVGLSITHSRRLWGLLQLASLLLLLAALFCTPEHHGFPFPWALLAVGGTSCFMVLSKIPETILNRFLSHWLLVYIGKLSYS